MTGPTIFKTERYFNRFPSPYTNKGVSVKGLLYVTLVFIQTSYLSATLGDVLHSAGETLKAGFRTAGEAVDTVTGQPIPRLADGRMRFTNDSKDLVYVTVTSDQGIYKEDGIERFVVKPGGSIILSPDLTGTIEVQVESTPEKKDLKKIPMSRKLDVKWNGREFDITPLS